MFELNKYYKLVDKNLEEPAVVQFYNNPDFHMNPNEPIEEGKDYSQVGFGFNMADGGGFLPLFDLAPQTKVIPIEMLEVNKPIKKALFEVAKGADQIVSFSFSCVNRNDETFTTFDNSWKPAMLIGEMACATKMVLDHEYENHRKIKEGE